MPTNVPVAQEVDAAAPEGLRVLLVEDEPINQAIATARLLGLGYVVDSASDGADAIAALEMQDYDVVLMDLMMPEMDGLEATRVIRTLAAPAGTVPIIALTGSSGDCYVGACLEAGMNDFLSKPLTDALLRAAIERVVEPRNRAPPAAAAPVSGARPQAVDAKRLLDAAEIFLDDTEHRLAAIQSLLVAGDGEALARAAHSLEGAAGSFGFHRLAAIAGEIGAVAASGRPLDLLDLLNQASAALSIARG